MTIQVQETARLCAMLEALAQLSKAGKKVAYNIEGPLTLLCALLPMNKVFFCTEKTDRQTDAFAGGGMDCSLCGNGSRERSKNHFICRPDCNGGYFRQSNVCESVCPMPASVAYSVAGEISDTVIHLCGKLTQSLIDTKQCTLTRWEGQKGQSYGQTLTEFLRQRRNCRGIIV